MRRSTIDAAAIFTVIALPLSIWQVWAQTSQGSPDKMSIISEVGVPPGTDALAVQWMQISAPDVGVLLTAVARPSGAGPFPAVVLLHGSHGFAQEYVRLARDLADGGVIAVAPCWFQGGGGAGSRFITPIGCPEAPPMPNPSSPEAMRTVDVLVQVARTLPGARAERIGLFGHSRGGGAALGYLIERDSVQAAVLNSTGYPPRSSELISQIKAPILMLHGTADSPEDGGAPVTNVQMARDFEAKMRAAGKSVEAVYFEGGRHNDIFTNTDRYRDEVQRIRSFLRQHLGT